MFYILFGFVLLNIKKGTMKNFLFIIAFLIVLTTVIVGSNPQMHKPMNIGGAKLEVQDNSNIKNTDLKVENKDSIIDKTLLQLNL